MNEEYRPLALRQGGEAVILGVLDVVFDAAQVFGGLRLALLDRNQAVEAIRAGLADELAAGLDGTKSQVLVFDFERVPGRILVGIKGLEWGLRVVDSPGLKLR